MYSILGPYLLGLTVAAWNIVGRWLLNKGIKRNFFASDYNIRHPSWSPKYHSGHYFAFQTSFWRWSPKWSPKWSLKLHYQSFNMSFVDSIFDTLKYFRNYATFEFWKCLILFLMSPLASGRTRHKICLTSGQLRKSFWTITPPEMKPSSMKPGIHEWSKNVLQECHADIRSMVQYHVVG